MLVVQMIPGRGDDHLDLPADRRLAPAEHDAGPRLVYIATVLPFTIWTLRGFVAGVPAELEEAAMIDGLQPSQAFWRVTFPLLAPGLVATGIFAFIQAWNEFTVRAAC